MELEQNNFEIKLSYLKQIDKYNVYILHLTSYKIVDNELRYVVINTENLDNSSRQVLGVYLIPRRKHKKTMLNITPKKCINLQKIYKKLDKVNNLVDVEGNDKNLYEELKKEYYKIDVEEFNTQEF